MKTLVCSICGGTNITSVATIDPNSEEILNHWDSEDNYCNDCEKSDIEFNLIESPAKEEMQETYIHVLWPESQEYMDKEWFQDEAFLGPNASYFIPKHRVKDFSDENFSAAEIEAFKEHWGQCHNEVCGALELDEEGAEDFLMADYFWIEEDQMWYPKLSSMYEEREQSIADYLRDE